MKRATGGFTLIEILAVSVVVLILAAIVLPMIGGMQKRGNGAKSIANMRQIGSGIAGYSGDNNGAFPQSAGTKGLRSFGAPARAIFIRNIPPDR